MSAPRKTVSDDILFGRGLNSIRVRFTLMIAVFVGLAFLAVLIIDRSIGLRSLDVSLLLLAATVIISVPTLITVLMTGKLTRPIEALRRSTEQIAKGDFDVPIEVDCACEIGGLAHSFRSMVDRFNANILRMNVLAYTDPVTRLPNRAVLAHVLDNVRAAEGGGKPFRGALLFIDLDRFKAVNDTLGHEVGDNLLRAASLRILSEGFGHSPDTIDTCSNALGELCDRIPESVTFVRFAGDEFVALVPHESDNEALGRIADRIILAMNRPFSIDGSDISIGASIGIARYPADSSDPSDLVKFADLAMYEAKEQGRASYAFFHPRLLDAALSRTRLEAEIRAGVERGEFTAHFQPKISSGNLALAGVEALARWMHPERGLQPPAAFIEAAEKSGLVEAVGSSVLRHAARQSVRWVREGTPINIAFNVCHLQFRRAEFVDDLLELFASEGADPRLFTLELTESEAMQDAAFTNRQLTRLKEAGLAVAIDDFGNGYSNLSQIAHLPVDQLKIDRSLIERIGRDPKAETILRGIVNLADALHMDTVAEGIETEEQYLYLRAIGCDTLQGFHFGRPMSAEALENWLAQRSVSPVFDLQQSIRCSADAA